MTKKFGFAVLTAGTIAAGVFGFSHYVDPYEQIDYVVDGDTFFLAANKQAVRLYGLDAPELENCYGEQAQQKLASLLKKKKVQLKEPLVDGLRRVLALVYVDGELINEQMLKEGYAWYDSHPGSGQDVMKAAGEYAKTNRLGIYSSACTDDSPPDPKCTIKGNNDQDLNKKLYLLSECPYYSAVNVRRFEGDRWFCTEKEAPKAGFEKSSACALGTNRNN